MRIVAVSTSARKGEKKINQPEAVLVEDWGVQGDVHADGTHRQLSLLAMEDIEYMRGLGADVHPGDVVTVFGGDDGTLLEALARAGGTINYEITSILTPRVRRVPLHRRETR